MRKKVELDDEVSCSWGGGGGGETVEKEMGQERWNGQEGE